VREGSEDDKLMGSRNREVGKGVGRTVFVWKRSGNRPSRLTEMERKCETVTFTEKKSTSEETPSGRQSIRS